MSARKHCVYLFWAFFSGAQSTRCIKSHCFGRKADIMGLDQSRNSQTEASTKAFWGRKINDSAHKKYFSKLTKNVSI